MKPNDALEILVKAVAIAQSKGAFNLAEAKIVAEAVEAFSQKPTEVPAASEPAPLPAQTDESVPESVEA